MSWSPLDHAQPVPELRFGDYANVPCSTAAQLVAERLGEIVERQLRLADDDQLRPLGKLFHHRAAA